MFELTKINAYKNKQNMTGEQIIHIIYSWDHIAKTLVAWRPESNQTEQWKMGQRSLQHLYTSKENITVQAR